MNRYNDFAYIYDRLMHQDVDYDAWCDYIENLLSLHSVSPDTLCELACGTGNMTSRLSGRGYKMTGVDISPDMLRVAQAKTEDVEFICSDMSKLSLRRKYDSFLCMIDGLNYVITPKAVINTLKTVKEHLNENGVFIFDISSQYKLEKIIGNETFIHSEYDVFYSWQNRYIEKYNLSDMLLNFFVRSGKDYIRFEENHIQRGWTVAQMQKMLKVAGFTEIHVYNELTFDEPLKDSERLVFVCR